MAKLEALTVFQEREQPGLAVHLEESAVTNNGRQDPLGSGAKKDVALVGEKVIGMRRAVSAVFANGDGLVFHDELFGIHPPKTLLTLGLRCRCCTLDLVLSNTMFLRTPQALWFCSRHRLKTPGRPERHAPAFRQAFVDDADVDAT